MRSNPMQVERCIAYVCHTLFCFASRREAEGSKPTKGRGGWRMPWGCKLIDTNKVTQQRRVLLIMMRSCLMILLIKPNWKFCNEVEAVAFLFNQQIIYKHSLKLFPLQFQWWPIDQGTIDSYVASCQYSPIIFYTNTSTLTWLFLHSEGSLMVKIL